MRVSATVYAWITPPGATVDAWTSRPVHRPAVDNFHPVGCPLSGGHQGAPLRVMCGRLGFTTRPISLVSNCAPA